MIAAVAAGRVCMVNTCKKLQRSQTKGCSISTKHNTHIQLTEFCMRVVREPVAIQASLLSGCNQVHLPTCRLLGIDKTASRSVQNKTDITCDAGALTSQATSVSLGRQLVYIHKSKAKPWSILGKMQAVGLCPPISLDPRRAMAHK